MDFSRLRTTSSALLAPVLWLCACTEPPGQLGQSHLSLNATGTTGMQADTPTEIAVAVVTIDEIRLIPSPEQTIHSVVLLDEPMTLDLIALSQTVTEMVSRVPIPAGQYQEIRCILSGAYIYVAGDGVYMTPDYDVVPSGLIIAGELVMPSLEQSGLKIKLDKPLQAGPGIPSKTWLLRFDVAESFGHVAGEAKWIMHPVVFATPVDATASIAVVVDTRLVPDADQHFAVRLDDAENHPEARVDLDTSKGYAHAELPYLLPAEGPYRLSLTTQDGLVIATNPRLPDKIPLKEGERLEVTARATGVAR
jgi:hypothetical protein